MNPVLETTKFVIDRAEFVGINQDRLVEFARTFEHGTTTHWLSAAPFDFSHLSRADQMRFVFLFNSLNFCYWSEPKWTVEYRGKTHDGAWGMIVALGRAIDEGVPLLEFGFLADIDRDTFVRVLRGNVEIPLFEERWKIAREIGAVMSDQFGGDVENVAREAGGDALTFVDLVTDRFTSFSDRAEYRGEAVAFNKRAQLLAADIGQLFAAGCGNPAYFEGTEHLTACADYKLPQILRKKGILEFVPDLADRIDRRVELAHGSPEEVEIRAATIRAVELIRREVEKRNPSIRSFEINDHLWLATQEKYPDDKPYHRTRTTAY